MTTKNTKKAHKTAPKAPKAETVDRVALATEALTAGITALIATEGWTKYLRAQAAFHRYSFQNVLWLMIQSAERGVETSRFAGFHAWKDVGRSVVKGAKGFMVLAPCLYKKTDKVTGEEGYGVRGFRVAYVFDVSQTDGEALPEVTKQLTGSSEELKALFDKLVAFSESRGVPVTREVMEGKNGYYHLIERRIAISETLSDTHALKTLCHEVSHSILHADSDGDNRATKEVEAESSAYLACAALGVASDDFSFGYIADWSKGNVKLVKEVGDRASRAAKVILAALEASDEGEDELAEAA